MTKKDIIDAYTNIRTIDNTIPDDVLDFMKNAAIEKLESEPKRTKAIYLIKAGKYKGKYVMGERTSEHDVKTIYGHYFLGDSLIEEMEKYNHLHEWQMAAMCKMHNQNKRTMVVSVANGKSKQVNKEDLED